MANMLCGTCRRIDFAALRGPSTSELNDLYSGRNTGHIYGSKTDDGNSRIRLGNLGHLRDEASRCGLCAVICHIIDRQGAIGPSGRRLDTGDICFVATAGAVSSYFGSIGTIIPAQRLGYLSQRLTLTAHEADGESGYGDCLAYLPHVLQARAPGANDLPVRGSSYLSGEVVGVMPFGARIRPSQIDLNRVRSWINICTKEHGAQCAKPLGRDTDSYPVRFIDVHRMSVVTFTDVRLSDIQYIALSYVWGPLRYQKTQLKQSNVSDLAMEASLTRVELPQTIQDAIDLTRLLDFEFLWVDALCIVQDDAEDQKVQISNMHGIYKTAFLTIVAASGEHSNVGLPGLKPGTRHYQQREVTVIDPSDTDPGLSLITTVQRSPQHLGSSYMVGQGDLELSVWNRRAWTMQEKALSRRTISFSEEQVSWDCPCASFWEEAFFEIQNLRCRSIISTSYHDLSLSSLAHTSQPWELYRNLVSTYSQRNLSFPGDYNDAFSAVIEMMTDLKGEHFLWGLPCSRFGLALSWDTIYGGYRRDALSKLTMTSLDRQVQFPSWSWLGWIGHAHCSVGDDRMESEQPTISCYVHRSKPLRFLPVHSIGSVIDSNEEFTTLDTHSGINSEAVREHIPELTEDALSDLPDDYVLFFWADMASFEVQPPDAATIAEQQSLGDSQHDARPAILDAFGQQVGTACRMQAQHWDSLEGGYCPGTRDFIVVGRRQIPEVPEFPATVLALQVRWADGIAYRTNIAEIDEREWLAGSPRRTLVALG